MKNSLNRVLFLAICSLVLIGAGIRVGAQAPTREKVKIFQSIQNSTAPAVWDFDSSVQSPTPDHVVTEPISNNCLNGEACPDTEPDLIITTDSDLEGRVGEYFEVTFRVTGLSGAHIAGIEPDGKIPGLNWTRTYCPPVLSDEPIACSTIISPDTITLFGVPARSGRYQIAIAASDWVKPRCDENNRDLADRNGCESISAENLYGQASFTIVIK